MSKPIKLTPELLAEIQREFVEAVSKVSMFDGVVRYEKAYEWDKETGGRATVVFSHTAYLKMIRLIQDFSTEVGWHGVVERDPESQEVFHIKDILVYPQIVTEATVDTDQEAYQQWLMDLDDDTFSKLRFHGHSHVDFSPTPSKTDLDHQQKILRQLDDDMFYIFQVQNKKGKYTIKVWDLLNNTLYDTKDVDVVVGDENLEGFMAEAKTLVKRAPLISAYGKKGKGKKKEEEPIQLEPDDDLDNYYHPIYPGVWEEE